MNIRKLKKATFKKADISILENFNNSQKNLKPLPEFRAGDEIKVEIQSKDSSKKKIDTFQGICLGRFNKNKLESSFTVRAVLKGYAVNKKFYQHSPNFHGITVIKRNKIRQSKPYYIEEMFGKSLRFKEDKKRQSNAMKLNSTKKETTL